MYNPDVFQPIEWAKMAKETGIKYFLIIAKHHDGLCNWDCKFTNYKIPNTPFKRDALKKVVKSKRAESIKVKFYYFLLDWQHPDFTINDFHPITPKNNVAKKDNINAIRYGEIPRLYEKSSY